MYIHTYIHTYICTYTHTHTHTHIYIYPHMYACMHMSHGYITMSQSQKDVEQVINAQNKHNCYSVKKYKHFANSITAHLYISYISLHPAHKIISFNACNICTIQKLAIWSYYCDRTEKYNYIRQYWHLVVCVSTNKCAGIVTCCCYNGI